MKVSVFHSMRCGLVPNQPKAWPVPNALFDAEQGMRAMNNSLELFAREVLPRGHEL